MPGCRTLPATSTTIGGPVDGEATAPESPAVSDDPETSAPLDDDSAAGTVETDVADPLFWVPVPGDPVPSDPVPSDPVPSDPVTGTSRGRAAASHQPVAATIAMTTSPSAIAPLRPGSHRNRRRQSRPSP